MKDEQTKALVANLAAFIKAGTDAHMARHLLERANEFLTTPAQSIADTAKPDDARDAERYRHLRRNATSRFGPQPTDDEFDSMIDKAIARDSK